jgi:branched-chain amino acid transport system substrate-binding protein
LRRARYLILFLAVALVALTLVSGCGGSGDDTTTTTAAGDGTTATTAAGGATGGAPFKIGLAAPYTGQYATYGAAQKAGADIAIEELNTAKVNGGTASYVIGDDLGDPKEAVLVAQKFIGDKELLFVNGHMFSGATLAAGPKYQQAKLPMITGSATNPDISKIGPYIWRIVMTDAAQGQGLADYSVKDLGKKKIAIIYDDSDYGRGLAEAFEKGVTAAGGQVVEKQQYTSGDSEFKAQLTKIKQANPELLFFSGYYPEGSKIAQQAKDLGITAQFIGSDGYASDQLMKLGGAAVEGMLVSTFFDYTKTDPAVVKYVAAFKAKNKGANPDYFSATSYDVINMVAAAAKKAGANTREAIQTGLGQLGTYQGITGPITFDAQHDVTKPLNIVVVKNGAFATAPIQPTATESTTTASTTTP